VQLKRLLYGAAGAAAVAGSGLRRLLQGRGKTERNSASGIRITALDEVPEEVTDLSRSFAVRWSRVTIFRDAAYYRWRLRDNPYTPSNLLGAYAGDRLVGIVAFVLNRSGIGFIVDLISCSGPGAADEALDLIITDMLLLEASKRLRTMGASCVRAWSVSDHPFDRLVREVANKQGFFHLRRGHGVVRYTRDATDRVGLLNDIQQWYVTRLYTEGTDG
jgi:hypothetical protein